MMIASFILLVSHQLTGVASSGANIEMEDQSVWTIHKNSRSTVSQWETGDHIDIRPNLSDWHNANYPFYLYNTSKGFPPVPAALQLGPHKASPHTSWIQEITPEGHILLEDGTTWQIEPKDLEDITDWEPMHAIIVGSNNALFARYYSRCKYLLINVNSGQTARASNLRGKMGG